MKKSDTLDLEAIRARCEVGSAGWETATDDGRRAWAESMRRYVLTLIARVEELEGLYHEQLDLLGEWQAASGLEDGSGDPGGIEPEHLSLYMQKVERELDAARAELAEAKAERTQLCAKVAELIKMHRDCESERNALVEGMSHKTIARLEGELTQVRALLTKAAEALGPLLEEDSAPLHPKDITEWHHRGERRRKQAARVLADIREAIGE